MERNLYARCQDCDSIFFGQIAWEVEDGHKYIDFASELARFVSEHHNSQAIGGHNGYRLYEKKEDAEAYNYYEEGNPKATGFMAVSSACAGVAFIDD